jgi:hypothetical protein
VHFPGFPDKRPDLVEAQRSEQQYRQSAAAPERQYASVDRHTEFAQREQIDIGVLRARLEQTIKEIDEILAKLEPADLLKKYEIQKYPGISALDAIYHVVEHFSMHYGQILYLTKALTGTDLGFYKHLSGRAAGT